MNVIGSLNVFAPDRDAGGPEVPVAPRIDDARLRAHVPGIPGTPLEEGIRKTIEWFDGAGDLI